MKFNAVLTIAEISTKNSLTSHLFWHNHNPTANLVVLFASFAECNLDETLGPGDATTSTDTNAANTGGCDAVQRRNRRVVGTA